MILHSVNLSVLEITDITDEHEEENATVKEFTE